MLTFQQIRRPHALSGKADPDPAVPPKPGRHISEATREAGRAAREAKRAQPDPFGAPEVFVVVVGGKTFAWELRRFGGVVLQRSAEVFQSQALARADGETALAALRASTDLPTFARQTKSKAGPTGGEDQRSEPKSPT